MLEQFLKWPKLIWSSLYEKIAEAAKKTNTNVKDYLGNEENIDYISKVVYEGIPFFFKFSLKPDAFDAKFKKHFTAFRDKMYSYDDELNAKKKVTEQKQVLKDWEQSQEAFNSRLEPHDDSKQWSELSGPMSKDEVHEKLNELMHQAKQEKDFKEICKQRFDSLDRTEIKEGEQGTRVKLLKEWQETQKVIKERAEAINDPKQLANMPTFTSDMSTEEIRNKFFNMVSEAREKRYNDDESVKEAHNIIMERAQSIPKDMSTWTRISGDMSIEEVISKVVGVSLEEAKRLEEEYNAKEELKKTTKARKPKTATSKVATKTTRKKKVEE